MFSLLTSAAALADSLACWRSLISTEGAITEDTPSPSGSCEYSGNAEVQRSLLSEPSDADVPERDAVTSARAWWSRRE